ncbi:hypothetical protein ACFFX0_28585 [Citricoccus parietis]|uniref:Uncharacterized protein n=1 Tax=Citricoccus parietis TaxID=592307 RepID=A0ABV5G8J2_9MICC
MFLRRLTELRLPAAGVRFWAVGPSWLNRRRSSRMAEASPHHQEPERALAGIAQVVHGSDLGEYRFAACAGYSSPSTLMRSVPSVRT